MPLSELVTSDAFTDQHLRVMLRVSEEATVKKDRYGNPPLHYSAGRNAPTPFQELVAEEAVAAIDERAARAAGIGPLGRFVDDRWRSSCCSTCKSTRCGSTTSRTRTCGKMQHGNEAG